MRCGDVHETFYAEILIEYTPQNTYRQVYHSLILPLQKKELKKIMAKKNKKNYDKKATTATKKYN